MCEKHHLLISFASDVVFSTLLQRLLGQKTTKDGDLSAMTLPEFLVHYPALQPYLLAQLSDAVQGEQNKLPRHTNDKDLCLECPKTTDRQCTPIPFCTISGRLDSFTHAL